MYYSLGILTKRSYLLHIVPTKKLTLSFTIKVDIQETSPETEDIRRAVSRL